MREKLIELLKKAKAKEQCDFLFGDIDSAIDMPYGAEYYADHLIANGVVVQEWISVKDRLPDNGKMAICDTLYFTEVLQWDERASVWVGKHSIHPQGYVTHWMPLPQPPKGA